MDEHQQLIEQQEQASRMFWDESGVKQQEDSVVAETEVTIKLAGQKSITLADVELAGRKLCSKKGCGFDPFFVGVRMSYGFEDVSGIVVYLLEDDYKTE